MMMIPKCLERKSDLMIESLLEKFAKRQHFEMYFSHISRNGDVGRLTPVL